GASHGPGDHRHDRSGRTAIAQGDFEPQPRLRSAGQDIRAKSAVPSGPGARAGGARADQHPDRLQDHRPVRSLQHMSLSLYDLFVSIGPFAKFTVVVLFLISLIALTIWFNTLVALE